MSVTAIINTDARGRLMATAEHLFAVQGYDVTSTRQIAAEAGLNLALISYYFGSKQELYHQIFRTRLEEMNLSLQSISWHPLPAAEQLKRFLKIYTDRYKLNGDFQRLLYREILFLSNSSIRDVIADYLDSNTVIFRQIMAEGVSKGNFKALNTSFVYMTIISIMSMMICDAPVAGKQPGQQFNYQDIENYLCQILLTENTTTAIMN